jgi:hypothetical protein
MSSISKETSSKQVRQKRVKPLSSNIADSLNIISDKDHRTVTIGNLKLTWPSYRIENTIYGGERFFIFNTCPIDTGLFILYHAYKAGTDHFRNLFESSTLDASKLLRHIFRLIEKDGWTVARLYWLTRNNLLTNKNKNGTYDLKDTMDAVVFKFIKTMQTYPVKSTCSCLACPKRIREYTNVHIELA